MGRPRQYLVPEDPYEKRRKKARKAYKEELYPRNTILVHETPRNDIVVSSKVDREAIEILDEFAREVLGNIAKGYATSARPYLQRIKEVYGK